MHFLVTGIDFKSDLVHFECHNWISLHKQRCKSFSLRYGHKLIKRFTQFQNALTNYKRICEVYTLSRDIYNQQIFRFNVH